MESRRGQLLIAGPALGDPNFWRTVVLIVEHTEDGALGLVLNRPSQSIAIDAVPELDEVLGGDAELLVGGPVAPDSVIVLAEFEDPAQAAVISFGKIGVVGTAQGDGGPQVGLLNRRAFAGHAGWGPGQLDAELERGDWILEPARAEDAFAADPQGLWARVLKRKGGSYALLARMPDDPTVN
jgi:putative transcriptional regulator